MRQEHTLVYAEHEWGTDLASTTEMNSKQQANQQTRVARQHTTIIYIYISSHARQTSQAVQVAVSWMLLRNRSLSLWFSLVSFYSATL